MESWLELFTNPDMKKSLSRLGGGFTAVSAATWAVLKCFHTNGNKNPSSLVSHNIDASSSVPANWGSAEVGRNLTISGPTIYQGPIRLSVFAIALAYLGIVISALVFAGNRIEADSDITVFSVESASTTIIASQGRQQ